VYRTEIERALDELISNEEGMKFQGLAVVLAKQKWPDLIACERKWDKGLDAYAPASLTADGRGRGLACSSVRFIGMSQEGSLLIRTPDHSSRELANDDVASGTIYVLRSKSEHPVVAAHRNVLHMIGVTGGKVETRIANAKLDPTFIMADVEVIATYELLNVNRIKLENVIHRGFDPAQLDIEIKDRFGNPIRPREWFLVPLFVVNEAVERIKDGSITQYIYDPLAARLVRAKS
jgi:hypothetical protein